MENNPNVPNISKPPTSHPIALIIKPGFSHGSDPMTFRERNELGTPTSESRIETCTAKIHTPLYGMYIVGISFNSTYINIYREREKETYCQGFLQKWGDGPPFFHCPKVGKLAGISPDIHGFPTQDLLQQIVVPQQSFLEAPYHGFLAAN